MEVFVRMRMEKPCMSKTILIVSGTRPEVIKMAPVYFAVKRTPGLTAKWLHTGQHDSLALPLYEFFECAPDVTLSLKRRDPSLSNISALLIEQCASVMQSLKPDAVLVQGDTTSAAMCALAAFYEKIPVGHVEAGLRTYERYSPFPEEMNRSLIGRIAEWHYAPTQRAAQALTAEGIAAASILVTGNTVVDAARLVEDRERLAPLSELGLDAIQGRIVLVTTHRRENWGDGIDSIAHAVCDLVKQNHDVFVVWPLHANPEVSRRVIAVIEARRPDAERLRLLQPLDYPKLLAVLKRSWMALTDSGGIQEECACAGVPVLILRESTERPELIEAGGGILVGADRDRIVAEFQRLSQDKTAHQSMRNITNPFGDGHAAARIAEHLENSLFQGGQSHELIARSL